MSIHAGVLLCLLSSASGLAVSSGGAFLSGYRKSEGKSRLEALSKLPHIVFILCDDLGWNGVGRHNSELDTPHIDKLFQTGITHNGHYTSPVCAPTRAAFLTGRLPYRTRASLGNFPTEALDGTSLDQVLLPDVLRNAGYTTHLVGKWHQGFYREQYLPTRRGFDSFYGFLSGGEDHFDSRVDTIACNTPIRDLYSNEDPVTPGTNFHTGMAFAARAVSIIWAHDKSKPMFLYLALQDPHGPIQAPEKYVQRYSFSNPSKNTYYAMHSVIDDTVRNVTAALREKDMYDETLIIFTSDNGSPVSPSHLEATGGLTNAPLSGGKGTPWEGGVRVPTAISGGIVPQTAVGREVSNMMSVADWYATLAHIAGVSLESSSEIDSLNQWPYLVGLEPSGPRTNLVLMHKPFEGQHTYDEFQGAGRVGHWKLIVGPQYIFDTGAVKCSKSPCLFNVNDDPGEHVDLAGDHPDKLKEMLEWWQGLENDQNRDEATLLDHSVVCHHFSKQGYVAPWKSSSPELVVWVHSFGRSSSSTVLSMVRAIGGKEEAEPVASLARIRMEADVEFDPNKKIAFTLFEPCHSGDRPVIRDEDTCSQRLLNLSNCDFNGIEHLDGWSNVHSTNYTTAYTPEAASILCSSADVVAFKTINTRYAGLPKLRSHVRLLEVEPRMRILDLVRDPRGIVASYKEQDWGELSIEDVCDCMAENFLVEHDRLHRIVFEDLVADPYLTVESAYTFLGLPYGEEQKLWIEANFDAPDCKNDGDRYADCHKDSQAVPEKWREVLSDDEKLRFSRHESCKLVAKAYGYPL